MYERRRAKRLVEDSDVTVTIIPGGKKFSKEKVLYNQGKDISAAGIKIQSNIFLPIDTLLKMDIKLKDLQQMINAMGKVKWIKVICGDECYNAGVEFVNTPSEAIQKLADYVSRKQKSKSTEKN